MGKQIAELRKKKIAKAYVNAPTVTGFEEEWGVSITSARRWARLYNIGSRTNRTIPEEWWKDKDGLLGTETDYKLAKMWGIAASTVHDRRERLGLPRYLAEHFRGHRIKTQGMTHPQRDKLLMEWLRPDGVEEMLCALSSDL